MKTFEKMIALAVVLLNTACEPYDLGPKPSPPSGNLKTISVSANLAPVIVSHDNTIMSFRWNGSATSNLADEVNLSLSYSAYNMDGNENFQIQVGSFSLWSDDHQHTLMGTYMGRGYQTNGQYIMGGDITVQSGTGKFAHKNATLTISIVHFNSFSDHAISEILIEGTIKAPDIVPA